MTPLEQIQHLKPRGKFYIEPVRLGHAVNFHCDFHGHLYFREVYYISRIYAHNNNSELDCQRWAHKNNVEISENPERRLGRFQEPEVTKGKIPHVW